MALHPQAAGIVALMQSRSTQGFAESDPIQARIARAATDYVSNEHVHEIRDIDAAGVPVRLYRPTADTNLGLLVYFHGGGWVLGSVNSHDGTCRSIANQSGCAVLSVEYRLAPEDPFPAGLEDSLKATAWAAANAESLGIDATRIAVGGDSAGGNLAAVVAQLQPVPIAFQVLIYPVTDCRMVSESYIENAAGPFLRAVDMDAFINIYLDGKTSTNDPRVSPICADSAVLASCPPAIVITAEHDPLRDEGEEYGRALIAAGVHTSIVRYFGMIHGFVGMAPWVDDGKHAITHVSTALSMALAPRS
jgi:acetyl esterase